MRPSLPIFSPLGQPSYSTTSDHFCSGALSFERRENSRYTGENTERKQHEALLIGLLRHQIERAFKCKASQPVALEKLRRRENTVALHVGCEPLDLLPSALAIELFQITS